MAHDYFSRQIHKKLHFVSEDFTGRRAAEGRAAVDQASATRPDLILMDIAMPHMLSDLGNLFQRYVPSEKNRAAANA